jgi:hypothetical protein
MRQAASASSEEDETCARPTARGYACMLHLGPPSAPCLATIPGVPHAFALPVCALFGICIRASGAWWHQCAPHHHRKPLLVITISSASTLCFCPLLPPPLPRSLCVRAGVPRGRATNRVDARMCNTGASGRNWSGASVNGWMHQHAPKHWELACIPTRQVSSAEGGGRRADGGYRASVLGFSV